MEEKTKDKPTGQLDAAWRDRLLLESLAGQILPSLIISEPEKADEIFDFLKNEGRTLNDFLQRYPEYQGLKINNSEIIDKRFAFSLSEQELEFFPIASFNHDIFKHLTALIKEKRILNFKEDHDYQYQLRVSLYNNFNRYLNRLLSTLEATEAETLCLALMNAVGYESFLKLLSDRLKISPQEITSNFLKPIINKKI